MISHAALLLVCLNLSDAVAVWVLLSSPGLNSYVIKCDLNAFEVAIRSLIIVS